MMTIECQHPSQFGADYIEYWDINGDRFWDYYDDDGRWVKRIINTEDCTEEWMWFDSCNCWNRYRRWWKDGYVVRDDRCNMDCVPRSPAHPIFSNTGDRTG